MTRFKRHYIEDITWVHPVDVRDPASLTNRDRYTTKTMNIIKDVMFEMYCHNTGCKREGHLQDRYGSVDTDTGWGQADHEACDKCGQTMEYFPPFKEDDNGL